MRRVTCAAMILAMCAVVGCKKMGPNTVALLDTLTAFSIERAKSFEAIRGKLTAKDADDAENIQEYLVSHGRTLENHAAAFMALSNAVKASNGKLNAGLRKAIRESIATAKAQHENFVLAKQLITAKLVGEDEEQEIEEWKEAHSNALYSQIQLITAFSANLDADHE